MLTKQRNFLRLRHAKAHDDGTLKNPLFLKVRTPRWRVILGVTIGMILVIAGVIGATHIPAFQLQAVTVYGTITLSAEAIQQAARDEIARATFPGCSPTNIYGIHLKTLEHRLSEQFPLQSVTVRRVQQSLEIHVVEKVTTIALRTKEKTAMLDVSGVYVRDATFEESRAIDLRIGTATAEPDEVILALQQDMPIVINTQNDPTAALSSDTVTRFITLAEQLPRNGMHAVAFYVDGLSAPFVRIDTTEGYDVYVDIGLRTIEEQMQSLHAIVSATDFTPPSEYIDLRFGAYVYTK